MTAEATSGKKNTTRSVSVENIQERQNDTEIKVLTSYNSLFNMSDTVNNNYHAPFEASLTSTVDINECISFLAHEVRNPLSSINLSIEILKTNIEFDQQKKYYEVIKRSSVRINDLIIQLLNYQKFEQTFTANSMIQILNEVLEIVADRIRLKHITVIKNFYAEEFIIITNRSKMKIALTNIIVNAIDAMPETKGILKLTGKRVTGKYLIEIEDNGCGISKENLQSIFDAGFTKKTAGSGFGLQITKTILQANNIEVKVESDEGEFTRFTLLFDDYLSDEKTRISPADSGKQAIGVYY